MFVNSAGYGKGEDILRVQNLHKSMQNLHKSMQKLHWSVVSMESTCLSHLPLTRLSNLCCFVKRL